MAGLSNLRHERFSQLQASGVSATQAYVSCGQPRRSARRLMRPVARAHQGPRSVSGGAAPRHRHSESCIERNPAPLCTRPQKACAGDGPAALYRRLLTYRLTTRQYYGQSKPGLAYSRSRRSEKHAEVLLDLRATSGISFVKLRKLPQLAEG